MTGRSSRTIRPSQCVICSHPDRALMEVYRADGVSLRAIASQFGVKKDSISRHFTNHVTDKRKAELLAGPARVQGLANRAAEESRSLLDYLSITRSVLFNQFLAAAECGDRNGVAGIGSKLLEALREIGRITGELRTLSGISITNNNLTLVTTPAYMALCDGLLRICRDYPDARHDIVALLRAVDTAPTPEPKPNGTHALPQTIDAEAMIHVA